MDVITRYPEIVWIIFGLIIVGIIIGVIVKATKSSRKRVRIYGMRCPKCHTDKVYWAGYSDRKICKKGHIFS